MDNNKKGGDRYDHLGKAYPNKVNLIELAKANTLLPMPDSKFSYQIFQWAKFQPSTKMLQYWTRSCFSWHISPQYSILYNKKGWLRNLISILSQLHLTFKKSALWSLEEGVGQVAKCIPPNQQGREEEKLGVGKILLGPNPRAKGDFGQTYKSDDRFRF